MELKRIDNYLLKALYLAEAGIVITQVLGLDSLTSVLFLVTFPVTVLLWLRAIRQTFLETDMIVIITAALAVVGVLINAAGANADIGFAYLKKLIMFIMALLFFQAAYRMRVDDALSEFIRKVVDFLVVFLIAMYFLRRGQMHMLNGRRTLYLTFGFSNPNMTALFLVSLYVLKMHRMFERKKWYVKLIDFLQLLLMAWFVVETQSRNALLVMVMFTAIAIWLIFRGHRNLRITKGWAILFTLMPAALVVCYMLLIENEWIHETFSFLVGEGKKLDSRVAIWEPALRHLWKSPVLGAYYQISNGTGAAQMHNSHMDIAASYGIPVLVLVCVLLVNYLHQHGRIYSDRTCYIYILGFACMIALGMGEAAVFSGGLGVYIMAGACLLLADRKDMSDTLEQ